VSREPGEDGECGVGSRGAYATLSDPVYKRGEQKGIALNDKLDKVQKNKQNS